MGRICLSGDLISGFFHIKLSLVDHKIENVWALAKITSDLPKNEAEIVKNFYK
tara:strand:+ start:22725 stop:22883 length:159 start_codon:yes stop_codon:yes gene_type:complete